MKRKNVLSFTIIFLIFALTTVTLSAKFNYKNFYSNISWKDLKKSGWTNKYINFNKINSELLSAAIFYETNRIRVKHNLTPFKFSRALMIAAFIHSRDMVRRNFMGHYSPVPGRRKPADRVNKYGKWKYTIGENVANTFAIKYKSGTSFRPPSNRGGGIRDLKGKVIPPHTYDSFAESVVDAWMHSPPHRRNILNPKFKVLGASAYFHLRGKYRIPMFKATQVFAGGMNDEIATPLTKKANANNSNLNKNTETNYRETSAGNSNTGSGKWKISMYSRYNYRNFKNAPGASSPINFKNIDYALLGAAIFYATNEQRARYNRPLFKYSHVLFKAAFMHSKDMVRYGFMGHTGRTSDKRSPSDRVRKFGKWQITVGENVAVSFAIRYKARTSFRPPSNPGGKIRYLNGRVIPPHSYWSFGRTVVNQWMHSPGHRRNILNSRFRRLGAVGYYYRKGRYKIPSFKSTQVFAGGTND